MDEIYPSPGSTSGVTTATSTDRVGVRGVTETGTDQVTPVNSVHVALETVDLADEEKDRGGSTGRDSNKGGKEVQGKEGTANVEENEERKEAGEGADNHALQPSEANRVDVRVTLPTVECCAKYDGGKSRVVFTIGEDFRSFPGLCMVGPDWPCLLYSYFLITFPSSMFLGHIGMSMSIYVMLGGLVLLIATLSALTITALSDPGIVQKRTDAQLEAEGGAKGRRMCVWCNVEKLPRMHHCFECNACIEELDHHCPWTGKCIGKKNILYFRAYLMLLTGLIVYVGGATLLWAVLGTFRGSR